MDFDPGTILTAAGATAASAAIVALLEFAKKLIPALDQATALQKQQIATVISGFVVAYAAFATNYVLSPVSIIALLAAWYGIARLTTATYDTARTTVQVVAAAVSTPSAVDGAAPD